LSGFPGRIRIERQEVTFTMKPIRLAYLAGTIALALTACGAEGDSPGSLPPPATAATAQVVKPTAPGSDCDADAQSGQMPTKLRCAGLYSDWTQQTIAGENTEFKPAVRLWSDGADKRRWVYLPPGSQIDSSDMNEWKFPVGTKFWKDFSFNGKHVETRTFWKTGPSTWSRTSYRWTADQTDAVRFETGDKNVDVGGPVQYEIPSTDECDTCHGGRQDKILGFDAVALGLAGATGVTLSSLVADGRLTANPPVTSLAIPEDSTGKAAAALGYLHANCGTTCHNRNDSAFCHWSGLFFRLGYEDVSNPGLTVADLDAFKTAVNVPAPAAGPEFMRIAPGDPAHSGIAYLMGRRVSADVGGLQMPLIDTHVVDQAGVAAVTAWIQALGAN
jgi:hypothetical protein